MEPWMVLGGTQAKRGSGVTSKRDNQRGFYRTIPEAMPCWGHCYRPSSEGEGRHLYVCLCIRVTGSGVLYPPGP